MDQMRRAAGPPGSAISSRLSVRHERQPGRFTISCMTSRSSGDDTCRPATQPRSSGACQSAEAAVRGRSWTRGGLRKSAELSAGSAYILTFISE